MKEMPQLIDELIGCAEGILTATKSIVTCGEKMISAAKAVKQIFTQDDEVKALPTPEPELLSKETATDAPAAKTYTFTDVRKAFSAKAHGSHPQKLESPFSWLWPDTPQAHPAQDDPGQTGSPERSPAPLPGPDPGDPPYAENVPRR